MDLVVDLQCPHCAVFVPALEAALAPGIARGDLRVRTHLLVREDQPASRDLVTWAMAASLESQAAFDHLVAAALGTNPDATPGGADAHLGEAMDLVALGHLRLAHVSLLADLVDEDQQRIASLGNTGTTPACILSDDRRQVVGRWQGDIDAQAVAASTLAYARAIRARSTAPAPADPPARP
jgi:hypothetical protein